MDESVVTRVMPNSIEAEQSVVGSMILDRQAIITAAEILRQDDFYYRQYGTMFQTMTPAFYINIPPLYGNPYGVPGLRCLQAPGGRWSVPASGWCG